MPNLGVETLGKVDPHIVQRIITESSVQPSSVEILPGQVRSFVQNARVAPQSVYRCRAPSSNVGKVYARRATGKRSWGPSDNMKRAKD